MQRSLAVLVGCAMVVAGVVVAINSQAHAVSSIAGWVVFGLLLAGALAMTWSPSDSDEVDDVVGAEPVEFTRTGH